MSIPTAITAGIQQARQLAVQTLTDVVEITREVTVEVDKWGSETPLANVVYTGPGLIQDVSTSRQTLTVKSAEVVHDTLGYVCKLPVEVDVQPGDWVKVTASLDPRHMGRSWRVLAVPTQGWDILHRCILDPDEGMHG